MLVILLLFIISQHKNVSLSIRLLSNALHLRKQDVTTSSSIKI